MVKTITFEKAEKHMTLKKVVKKIGDRHNPAKIQPRDKHTWSRKRRDPYGGKCPYTT